MTVAELIAVLSAYPYNQPVEIKTVSGDWIDVIGVEHIGHGVQLLMTYTVDNESTINDLELEICNLENDINRLTTELEEFR